MAEAKPIISQTADVTPDTIIEARRLARNAVKEEWQGQGRRMRDYSAHDIVMAASVYLDQHRDELISRACANLLSRAQRRKR
jgi:hypothetical protein